jgi:MFS family permease
MILFLQFNNLSYSEIFWVYTIAAIANIILEVPTGIIADLFGKKRTMIISRIFTVAAYLVFWRSHSFWYFVIAQLLVTLGESFKSGTDVAYIYDYLDQKKPKEKYTEVKGKQKFWARIGEAIATSIGGFIVKYLGYNAVFLFAAVPALLNMFVVMSFDSIKENSSKGKKVVLNHVKESVSQVFKDKALFILVMNITLFITISKGAAKFIQPYMVDSSVPIEWFGIIYAISFILTAIAVRYSYKFEEKFSQKSIINWITLIMVLPLIFLGMKFISIIGVLLFFLIIIGENIRSPIDNHLFHDHVRSKNRATMGSILMLFRNVGLAIFLPLFGHLADKISFYPVLLMMAGMMGLNYLVFRIK